MDEQATTPRWAPDPTGRHHQRFWDGRAWTEHVADGVTLSVDPLDGVTTPPGTEHLVPAAPRSGRLPRGWSLGPVLLAGSAAVVVVGAIALVALQDPAPDTLTIDPGPTTTSTAASTSTPVTTSTTRPPSSTRAVTTTRYAAPTTVKVRPTTRPASTTVAPTTSPATRTTSPTSRTTSSTASSTTTTTATTKTGLDPIYFSCAVAKRNGYGPYYRGKDPEYFFYPDPNNDGIACP